MNVTVPITITKAGAIKPVSLTTRRFDGFENPLVVLVYSDGSEKLITFDNIEEGAVLSYENGSDISIDISNGCSKTPTPFFEVLGDNPPLPITDMNPVWKSCTMDGVVPKGIIEFQGNDCILKFDLSDNQSVEYAKIDIADVIIMTA